MRNCLLLFTCFLFFSFDQPKLMKVKVNDNITISVPKDWSPMDNLDFTERYPSVRAPLAAYTNVERTIDFSVNISATRWPDRNHEMAAKFFKSSLRNMFDRIEIIDEGIKEVNGVKFISFRFESRVNGNKNQPGYSDPVLKYTHVQYLIQPDRTLVFSFNCPRQERHDWEKTASTMMNNIRIR